MFSAAESSLSITENSRILYSQSILWKAPFSPPTLEVTVVWTGGTLRITVVEYIRSSRLLFSLIVALNKRDHLSLLVSFGACLDAGRCREAKFLATREPPLMRYGPFLHIQARWKQRTAPYGPVWVVWVRSGAHSWGLCTAQLQHKWIFTWLCGTFSFLPRQVSKNRASPSISEFGCNWLDLLNVFFFHVPPFARCAHACQIRR